MDAIDPNSEDFYILVVEESPEDSKSLIELIAETEQSQGDEVKLLTALQNDAEALIVKSEIVDENLEVDAEVPESHNQKASWKILDELTDQYAYKIRTQSELLQKNAPGSALKDRSLHKADMLDHNPGSQAHVANSVRLAPQKFNTCKSNNVLPRQVRRAIKIPCTLCGKMICNANMKLHLEVHSESKKFWCPHCPARFRTKRAVQAHLNAHSGTRPYRCDQCPRAYTSDTALRAHKMDHGIKKYKCEYCKQAYSRKHTLKSHLTTHSDGREYLCTECGKVFNNQYGLDSHSRQHRTVLNKFSCMDCGKMYSKMTGLNVHMKKKHGHQIITRKMFFNSLPLMVDVSALLVEDDETSDNVDDPGKVDDPGNVDDLEVGVNSNVIAENNDADLSEATQHLEDIKNRVNNMETAEGLLNNNINKIL